MKLAFKLVYFTTGLLAGAFGLLVVAIGLIGIIDPAGAKLSDDADPFGPTTGIGLSSSIVILVGTAVVAGGAYLIWRMDKVR